MSETWSVPSRSPREVGLGRLGLRMDKSCQGVFEGIAKIINHEFIKLAIFASAFGIGLELLLIQDWG